MLRDMRNLKPQTAIESTSHPCLGVVSSDRNVLIGDSGGLFEKAFLSVRSDYNERLQKAHQDDSTRHDREENDSYLSHACQIHHVPDQGRRVRDVSKINEDYTGQIPFHAIDRVKVRRFSTYFKPSKTRDIVLSLDKTRRRLRGTGPDT
ncbi:hypothetical protein KIN20_016153 [Parelaphostrongylus tenuis]|uniref:Uncharacterized protein n=1 Tax=Parelaphostrongylus tenuis TaxID=148309 RepID=A0AAD5MY75_PARTN|nr:hypothetical protein KIN20_016153 [Parelaphostrongylus tenuis]